MACTDKVPVEYEEEIFVLKSIFNEDFLSVDNKNPPYTFDLIIRFDSLIKNILLIHEESTEVCHLPPITLRITYRPTYPEVDPPLYCILCDYLTCDQLFSLANEMDTMWKSGEVIIYTWIEFLKDYFYNLNNQLTFTSKTESSIDDQRFLTNYNKIGSRRIYEQLIEYNRIQNQLKFEQTNHICPICLEEKSGKNSLEFEQCHHYACLSCLHSYAKEHLSNIQLTKQINCYQCNSTLFLSEVRRIFSNDKLFLKYQQHLIEMIWCPRCHHSIVWIPSESLSGNHPSFVECLNCRFTFCRRCEETWHPQIQCPKEQIIQKIIQNPDQNSSQLNKIELKKLLLEIENVQMIEQCSKPCPSCSVRIEKNGGCQHMNCRACQIHFCWVCGWYGKAYIPHPCEPKTEKTEVLLSTDVGEKILYDENGREIQSDVAKRVQICPTVDCREVHVKIGKKNMIICGKCGKSFCFLCGETVYGLFHYSEYGCRVQTSV